MQSILKKLLLIGVIGIIMFLPLTSVLAQQQQECPVGSHRLEVKLPGFGDANGCVNGPSGYIIPLFKLSLGFGIIAASMMMILGALKYGSAKDNTNQKKDALEQFWQAMLGLFLLFAVTFILRTINPGLTNLGSFEEGDSFQSAPWGGASNTCSDLHNAYSYCIQTAKTTCLNDCVATKLPNSNLNNSQIRVYCVNYCVRTCEDKKNAYIMCRDGG